MARIPFPDVTADQTACIRERRDGFLPDLYRMMLHSPIVTRAWAGLGAAIRYETELPPDLRELSICNVAAKTGSEYEWHHHSRLALAAGVTASELQSLHDRDESEHLKGPRLACVEYTTAVVTDAVDDRAVRQIADLLGLQGLVDLTALASYYTAAARFIAALNIDIETPAE